MDADRFITRREASEPSMYAEPASRAPFWPVVLLVDSDVAWRRRVARALRCRAIIRAAGTVESARRSLAEAPIHGVVLELTVAGDSTLPLVEELRGRQPTLALTASTDVLDASRLSALGAGFASKLEPRRSLHAKLERLAICARVQGQARTAVIERLCASAPLTPAERETLRVYLSVGKRGELSRALRIAETSVRSRVRAVCHKLGIEHLSDVYRLLFELAVEAEALSRATSSR